MSRVMLDGSEYFALSFEDQSFSDPPSSIVSHSKATQDQSTTGATRQSTAGLKRVQTVLMQIVIPKINRSVSWGIHGALKFIATSYFSSWSFQQYFCVLVAWFAMALIWLTQEYVFFPNGECIVYSAINSITREGFVFGLAYGLNRVWLILNPFMCVLHLLDIHNREPMMYPWYILTCQFLYLLVCSAYLGLIPGSIVLGTWGTGVIWWILGVSFCLYKRGRTVLKPLFFLLLLGWTLKIFNLALEAMRFSRDNDILSIVFPVLSTLYAPFVLWMSGNLFARMTTDEYSLDEYIFVIYLSSTAVYMEALRQFAIISEAPRVGWGRIAAIVVTNITGEMVSRNNLIKEFLYKVIAKRRAPLLGQFAKIFYDIQMRVEYVPSFMMAWITLTGYAYSDTRLDQVDCQIPPDIDLSGGKALWIFLVVFIELGADVCSTVFLRFLIKIGFHTESNMTRYHVQMNTPQTILVYLICAQICHYAFTFVF